MFVEHKEYGEASPHRENTPQAPMKLSEAIREGINFYPRQGVEWNERNPCTLCGAAKALDYGGYSKDGTKWDFLKARFPELNRYVRSPEQDSQGADLYVTIQALNGFSLPRWSRESIADWLESQGY